MAKRAGQSEPDTRTGKMDATLNSPNFAFRAKHQPVLVRYAAQAERYFFDDPSTALIKLHQFAEVLAKEEAAYAGAYVDHAHS